MKPQRRDLAAACVTPPRWPYFAGQQSTRPCGQSGLVPGQHLAPDTLFSDRLRSYKVIPALRYSPNTPSYFSSPCTLSMKLKTNKVQASFEMLELVRVVYACYTSPVSRAYTDSLQVTALTANDHIDHWTRPIAGRSSERDPIGDKDEETLYIL